jgi:hypothetical protein
VSPLSAHEELRALVQRYARAADDRDVDRLAALFHPEAEINGVRGAQTIGEWLESMRGPRAFPTSMHVLGDPLIDLSEGGVEATLDIYAVVYQVSDRESGNADLTMGMRYLDDVVHHQGRWVIRKRTTRTIWMR